MEKLSRDEGSHGPIKVVIVGCGLGGISCAISCLKEGLDVTILEQAAEIKHVGAGIQLPPNAVRVMRHYGLVDKLDTAGAVELEAHSVLSYKDGELITERPAGTKWWTDMFGETWYVVHRADYHTILFDEAVRLGLKIRLNSKASAVDFEMPSVTLTTGEEVFADVVVGADGLWSATRDQLLGHPRQPQETGDLAYRATIPRKQAEALNNPLLKPILEEGALRVWAGPKKHVVLYPIRGMTEYNMVLLRPDDLPTGISTAEGDIQEMRDMFKDWDPRLNALISCIDKVLKWKLLHMTELDSWVKGSVALLGDACHPTLPYQAQGAAMAVEDGAVIGLLLGQFNRASMMKAPDGQKKIHEVLMLYESMRKSRTTTNVKGAIQNKAFYQMEDGPSREQRDKTVRAVDWFDPNGKCEWDWASMQYQRDLMGFDTIGNASTVFQDWAKGKEKHCT